MLNISMPTLSAYSKHLRHKSNAAIQQHFDPQLCAQVIAGSLPEVEKLHSITVRLGLSYPELEHPNTKSLPTR